MRRIALASALTTGVLLAAGGVVVVTNGADHSRTAAGTTIAGVPAGDLNAAGLRSLLEAQADQAPATVQVALGVARVDVKTEALGLTIDVAGTVQRALDTSPGGKRFGFRATTGREVTPVLTTDATKLDALTARLVKAADIPESHGELVYSFRTISAKPPADGQSSTPSQVRHALEAGVQRLPLPATIAVPTTPRPAHVTAAAVSELAAQATRVVQSAVTVTSNDRSETLSGSELGRYLTVASEGEGIGHPITLGFKPTMSEAVAEPLAKKLSNPVVEPRVAAPAATAMLTTQGNVTWRPKPASTSVTAGGRAGQTVSTAAVLAALLEHVRQPAPGSTVNVLSQTTMPKTSDEAARGINALLGTFTTPFQCCPPRVTNIRLVAKTIDGTLIAPGETFSLNGIVGQRTRAKGYVEAPFILDGELSTDIGGGVSQFATTALNAAFFAGLQLDRFQPHSFYISRYPAGREATVNYPGIDLKWTNSTSFPVLVRAATTQNSLTVAIYGRDDGRTVQGITGPRQPVKGRDFRITITRVVSLPGQQPTTRTFTTTYNKPPEDH